MMEVVFQLKNQNKPIGKTTRQNKKAWKTTENNWSAWMNYFGSEKTLHKMQTSQKHFWRGKCVIAWIYNCAFHICKTWLPMELGHKCLLIKLWQKQEYEFVLWIKNKQALLIFNQMLQNWQDHKWIKIHTILQSESPDLTYKEHAFQEQKTKIKAERPTDKQQLKVSTVNSHLKRAKSIWWCPWVADFRESLPHLHEWCYFVQLLLYLWTKCFAS